MNRPICRRILIAGLVLAAVGAPERASAGPWTPEPGEGYAKVWFKWLPGFAYIDGEGNAQSYGTYHELFFSAYGEVGIAPGLALTLHSDLVRGFWLEDPVADEVRSHVAPGDPALGLRVRLLQVDRFVLSLEGSVRAPLATGDGVQSFRSTDPGNPELGSLRIGAGVWDFLGGVQAGYAWDTVYVAGGVAFIGRTNDYEHILHWTVEAGMNFTERIAGRARVTGHYALGNGDAPPDETPSGLGNGTSYTGAALEGDYRIGDRWFVGLSLEGGLFLIQRQTGGPVVSVYLATKF